MIGEVIDITERSRKSTIEEDDDKLKKSGDWPQYLSEQEVLDIMQAIEVHKTIEAEEVAKNLFPSDQELEADRKQQTELWVIQDDGTFVNQYDSSMVQRGIEEEPVQLQPLNGHEMTIEEINTIIIDGEEVQIDKESMLNYEDMLMLNGENETTQGLNGATNPYLDQQYISTGVFNMQSVSNQDSSSL